VYGVPLAPLIWVDGPAAVVVAAAGEVSDVDVADVVAEGDVPLVVLVLWHAEPSSANATIAMENAAVRFVISRISFLSNWIDDRWLIQFGLYCAGRPPGKDER